MALSLGVSGKAGSATGGTTAAQTTTPGSGIHVLATVTGTTQPTISDSFSNSFTLLGSSVSISSGGATVWHFKQEGGTRGAGHTFTIAGTDALIEFIEIVGSGVVVDVFNQAADVASPFDSPSITPTVADFFLTSGIGSAAGGTPVYTAGNSFTKQVEENNSSVFWTGAMAYRAVTGGSGGFNSTWTIDVGAGSAGVTIAAWKETGVVSSPTVSTLYRNSRHPGRSPGKCFASGRFMRPPLPGVVAPSGTPLGNVSISITASPAQGGAVLLTAFDNTSGLAAIGAHTKVSDSGTTSPQTTPGVTTQASGSTFVIDVIMTSSSMNNVQDNMGNTYSLALQVNDYSTTFDLARWVCLNGVGGAGHTFTVVKAGGAGTAEVTLFATEITNCISYAAASNGSVGVVDGTNPIDSPTLNVTSSAAVLLAAVAGDGFGSNNTFTASGYTGLEAEPAATGNNAQGATLYQLAGSAGGSSNVSAADTGAGSEATSILAGLTGSDNGAASEATALLAGLTASDSGGAAEATTVQAGITTADTGAASEATATLVGLAPADTGSGAEAAALASSSSVADTGTGTDGSAVQAGLADADTAGGADAAAVVVSVAAADTGGATEGTTLSANPGGTDTGAASELAAIASTSTVADTGAATESAAIAASSTVADAATATDSAAVAVNLLVAETAAATNAAAVMAAAVLNDIAAGVEAATLFITIALNEAAAGAEATAIAVSVAVADSAAAVDAAVVNTSSMGPRITAAIIGVVSVPHALAGATLQPALTGVTAQPASIIGVA